jgi:hypothetical protein
MDGQPVWLASVSRFRSNGRRLYVPEWSLSQMREGERELRRLLVNVGDPLRERVFRMNVTLCLHRAATDAEVEAQPDWFMAAAGNGLAGGPVAVIAETVAGAASTKPCVAPGKTIIDRHSMHGWIPKDCGACEPCRARARFDAESIL